MQESDEHLALAQQLRFVDAQPLVELRLLYLEDQISGFVHLAYIG